MGIITWIQRLLDREPLPRTVAESKAWHVYAQQAAEAQRLDREWVRAVKAMGADPDPDPDIVSRHLEGR